MAEQLLKKLRRLDGNMRCANCDKEAPRGVGFGHVCVKYKTFICDLCKTSHQAISHRVKSVSTSNWSMEEVQELMPEKGGGNEAARRTFLANAPEVGGKYQGGSRPKEGDKIEIYKQFVLDAYEYGKFKGSGGAPAAALAPAPAPVSAPEVDLLGGPVSSNGRSTSGGGSDSFDAFGGSSASSSSAKPSFDAFGSSGDPFASGISSGSQGLSSSDGFDAFGGGFQAPASGSTPASDPFSSSNSSSMTSVFGSATAAADPFAASSTILQPTPMTAPFSNSTNGMVAGGGMSAGMQGGTNMGMQGMQRNMNMGMQGGTNMGMQGGTNMGMQGMQGMQGMPSVGTGMGMQQSRPQMGLGMHQSFTPSSSMGAMRGVSGGGSMQGTGGAKTGMFSPGGAAVGGGAERQSASALGDVAVQR